MGSACSADTDQLRNDNKALKLQLEDMKRANSQAQHEIMRLKTLAKQNSAGKSPGQETGTPEKKRRVSARSWSIDDGAGAAKMRQGGRRRRRDVKVVNKTMEIHEREAEARRREVANRNQASKDRLQRRLSKRSMSPAATAAKKKQLERTRRVEYLDVVLGPGTLGIHFEELIEEPPYSMFVWSVVKGWQGHTAGILPDDVLTAVNGQQLNGKSFDAVMEMLLSCSRPITLKVMRDAAVSNEIADGIKQRIVLPEEEGLEDPSESTMDDLRARLQKLGGAAVQALFRKHAGEVQYLTLETLSDFVADVLSPGSESVSASTLQNLWNELTPEGETQVGMNVLGSWRDWNSSEVPQ